MSTIPAFHSGVSAIQTGINAANKSSAALASTNGESLENLTAALLELEASKQQVEAAAKVIQTSNDMLGSLLDIKV